MDDENETLDWGNEEEDNQESHRKYSSSSVEQDGIAVDDVEDTISLGDDDDDQGYYPYRQNVVDSAYPSFTGNDRKGPDSDPTGPNEDTRRKHYNSGREKERERSPLDDSRASPTKRRSMSKSSPPGSHTRMTHALPPKPATLTVPVLPPSHSSIIAATSMTSPLSAGRDSKKVNGKAAAADLPQDWETRLSRKNEVYYYNLVTHECTWSLPVGKVSVSTPTATHDDSRSHRQRRSVSPAVSKQITPKESNANNSQRSQSNRDSSRNGQSDPGIEDGRRPRTPDLNLTYEDRHYRPGGDSFPTSNTVRAVERLEISPKTGRYARSPSPHRRRAKTISPDSRGTELRARAKDPSHDQRSGREKSAYTNPAPKLDSYRPEYERRWSPPPRPRSPTEYAMRLDREPKERTSRRPPDQGSMSVDLPDYKAGRPPGRKEESNREQRGRSRDRNPPIRDLDPGQSAKQSNYVSAQRSRSPPQHLQPRERDRGTQERERDQRTRGREAEHEPLRYRRSPPLIPAGVSDGKEREIDREKDREGDRPRRSDRSDSRSANGPFTATKTQDVAPHVRSRESDKPVDTVPDRRDDRERDKDRGRGRGRGSERDSDRSRPEPLPISEGTSSSRQRLPESYPPGPSRSNTDDPQGRSGGDNNSVSGEASSLRPKRAPLPPQQMSFRSARLREPPLHAPAIPAVMADGTLPNSNVPRHPRSQTHAGAPDVRHPRNEPRQNNDSVLSRTRSSSDMKMDVDQDEVSKSGGRLSPLGVRNPGSAERSRPEFDLQHPSRTSSASERRPDLPLGTPSGPAALSRDSVKYVQSDNSKPDGRSGKEGDRVVRPAEPEKNNSRRNREPPSQPAARLTGTNNIPIKSRRSAVPSSRPPDLAIPKQPSSTLNSRLPASEFVPERLSNPSPVNPPRDLPPGKECYERPPDLVISDPPRRGSGRSSEKSRPKESRFSKKPDDRPQLQVPQSATGQDRIRNNSVKHSRDLSDSTPTAPKSVIRSTDGWPDGKPNGGETAVASSDRFPSKPRESNFKPPGPARDTQHNAVQPRKPTSLMTEHPARTSVDVESSLSQRLSANEERFPSHRLKSAPQTIRDHDWPDDSTANDVSKGRSPFISRVEPPRSGSLLDRLSIDDNRHRSSTGDRLAPSPSLRDRLLPSKRDRDEMLKGEGPSGRPELNDRFYEPDEGSETKRARRRGGKGRRSGGSGGNGRKF